MARKTPTTTTTPATKTDKVVEKESKKPVAAAAVVEEVVEPVAVTEAPKKKKEVKKLAPIEQAEEDTSVEAGEGEVVESEETATEGTDSTPNLESMMKKNIRDTQILMKAMQKLHNDAKKNYRLYLIDKRKYDKLESKKAIKGLKKKRSGQSGLDKVLPIQTKDFTTFVERHWQQLNDKDQTPILTELQYDTEGDGSLLLSRKTALRLVTSYVKLNDLQNPENKRKIRMNKELIKLFPDFSEKKEGGKVVREENFEFTSIMKGLSRHFRVNEEVAVAGAASS